MVADDPDNKIELKTFHCSILNNHAALKNEEQLYKPIPIIRQMSNEIIQMNYRQIKHEIEELIDSEMGKISNNSEHRAAAF